MPLSMPGSSPRAWSRRQPQTGERCCAVVVLADGVSSLTIAELAEHCAASGLAKQKVPEQLEIVDALARNAMGKILKQELRERYRGTR